MNSTLSISHLMRHFFLFAITLLLLFSISRAGFNLWQFHKIPDTQTLIQSFVQGLRFDLATIGLLLAVPVVLVPLLGMFSITKGMAKFILVFWLLLALLLVLVLEFVTPYFISQSSVRPDMAVLSAIKSPVSLLSELWSSYLVPAIIGSVLVILIMISFGARLESHRMLRYPVKKIPAILLAIVGLAICVLAMRSSFDMAKPPLGVDAALISTETVINEITLNSTYKSLLNFASTSEIKNFLPKIP